MALITGCILQQARLLVNSQQQVEAATCRAMYSTKPKYNMNKKVQSTVEKMLLKRPKLRKKYYNTSHINQGSSVSTVNSADFGSGKVKKTAEKARHDERKDGGKYLGSRNSECTGLWCSM